MKLTNTAREHFYNWYEKNAHISKFNKTRNLVILHFIAQSETCQNALIIEFFDSVGIKILIDTLHFQNWFFYKIKHHVEITEDVVMYNSRTEAINAAIEKANTIYNEKI